MKRAFTVATVLLVPALAVTFFVFRPSHRIPENIQWILGAEKAEFYEMDSIYQHRATIGEFSDKPLFDSITLPNDNGWWPVEEPRLIYRDTLKAFQDALTVFDQERAPDIYYSCELQPRACLRFTKGYVVYDVFICLTCEQVLIKDVANREAFRGKMTDSSPLFTKAVATVLPRDRTVKAAQRS